MPVPKTHRNIRHDRVASSVKKTRKLDHAPDPFQKKSFFALGDAYKVVGGWVNCNNGLMKRSST